MEDEKTLLQAWLSIKLTHAQLNQQSVAAIVHLFPIVCVHQVRDVVKLPNGKFYSCTLTDGSQTMKGRLVATVSGQITKRWIVALVEPFDMLV
jgi:hypothetical protein